MTEQPAGPHCGNNPNVQLTPADRQAVDDFKARLALRARIADTLAATDGWRWVSDSDKARSSTYRGYQTRADAVLAVLPAPADRAAILREAADTADRLMDERYGPDCSYAIGGEDVARELRRMAGEAQQPETQAAPYPPETSWQIETRWHDGAWRSWALRTDHDEARNEFERAKDRKHAWRLVRFHTTTAVEAEHAEEPTS